MMILPLKWHLLGKNIHEGYLNTYFRMDIVKCSVELKKFKEAAAKFQQS
jgi:hypothetical protein